MTETMRKITISFPQELVDFANGRAGKLSISRSKVVSMALSLPKSHSEQQLAAEGYRFYAEESSEFAALFDEIIAETWTDAGYPNIEEGSEHGRQTR